MDLVDWIGQVPSSGEEPRFGERFLPSFRPRTLKVLAETPQNVHFSAPVTSMENVWERTDWSSGGNPGTTFSVRRETGRW